MPPADANPVSETVTERAPGKEAGTQQPSCVAWGPALRAISAFAVFLPNRLCSWLIRAMQRRTFERPTSASMLAAVSAPSAVSPAG